MENLFFVSGLPRSGSTLLLNILGQNPNHHVTPTNGLVSLLTLIQNYWHQQIEFRSQGLDVVKPRIKTALKGMIEGFYVNEFKENKIIFDKSRGWLTYIEELEQVLQKEIKIIVPIRDIREILVSFENLYRKRDIDWRHPVGDTYFQTQNVVDRCNILLNNNNVLGVAINRVRDAIQRKPDRLIILPYRSFVINPQKTLDMIHNILNLNLFKYNTNNIKQLTHEDDNWHGMNLHIIKPEIEVPPPNNWEGILPEKYANQIYENYKELNILAGRT